MRFAPLSPLISTGLKPGDLDRELGSRFNGFHPGAAQVKPLKRFHLPLAANTRLKPGANEIGLALERRFAAGKRV